MQQSFLSAFYKNFLGNSPEWYKLAIIGFLILNPILYFYVNPYIAGWALVIEFIFTLAMALKCYPLQPGGLLAIEAVAIGMMVASRLSEIRSFCEPGFSDRLGRLMIKFGLPLDVPKNLDPKDIMETMKLDKKVIAGLARLILVRQAGHGFIDSSSDKLQIIQAIKASQST